MYSLPPGQTSGGGSTYGRSTPTERWQGDSLLSPMQRHDMTWGSTGTTALSPSHTLGRRREGSTMQSEQWTPIQSQSARSWQGGAHDSVASTTISGGGIYQDRSRARAASHQYEGGNHAMHRRDTEGGGDLQQSYPVRYTPHPAGTREGALQRLHWHTRDTSESSRDPRRSTPGPHTYSSSPTIPFPPQGYHNPTYTSSWTTPDALLSTPTLHSISNQPNISYDGAYPTASNSIVSSPDDYPNVEEFRES